MRRAIDANGVPDQVNKVNFDKGGAHNAGIEAYNNEAKRGSVAKFENAPKSQPLPFRKSLKC